nr:hypothetical protein [Paracoccus aminovorans]
MPGHTQPGGHSRGLSIRQKVDDSAALEITDQGAVALPLAPRPVVNADDTRSRKRLIRRSHCAAQEGVFADVQQNATPKWPGQVRPHGPTNKILEAACSPTMRLRERDRDCFAKRLDRALRNQTSEPSHRKAQLNSSAVGGQICETADIAPMSTHRLEAALRTDASDRIISASTEITAPSSLHPVTRTPPGKSLVS